ncbi:MULTISPECIES: hypothetical protein [unclassified Kitasatospora]|nr:hypothetical protein [Kitasatospora sp. MBT66]
MDRETFGTVLRCLLGAEAALLALLLALGIHALVDRWRNRKGRP